MKIEEKRERMTPSGVVRRPMTILVNLTPLMGCQ